MVDYIRYVIYLNEYSKGKKQMVRPGFARLECRDNVWNMALAAEQSSIKGEVPLYIVGEKESGCSASRIGDYNLHNPASIRLPADAVQFIREQQTVCGILAGTPEHYLAGNCPGTSREISFDSIEFKDVHTSENPQPQQVQAAEIVLPENQEIPKKEEIQKKEEMPEEAEVTRQEAKKPPEETEERGPHFQPMYPFEDDEFERCYQIEPKDIGNFSAKQWHLAGSSFLLQGYYNYRHLLYAQKKGKGYIGVPGQFHRREQYLASRFGFPRFKGTQKKRVTLGDFGYWMREMEG